MTGLSDFDPLTAEPDPRIVLVTITEQDIQTLGSWPLSDDVLAQALESVARFGPRAIGVDIYRDLTVPPGSERLTGFLAQERPDHLGQQVRPRKDRRNSSAHKRSKARRV